MPTLRPQKLSGLVVTPTVEHDPGIYRVSIAIDTGESRSGNPPPQIVNREDLVVELKNPSEGSLEPIASPDPGPLPVRALRVVQARAEFTFAQGVNAATGLSVALRGDRKSFPMAQTFSPTSCLGREPKQGGPFQGSAAAPKGGMLVRIPGLGSLLRPGCRVRRFEVPLSTSTDPAAKSEFYEIVGDFSAAGRRFRCRCCEYRQ